MVVVWKKVVHEVEVEIEVKLEGKMDGWRRVVVCLVWRFEQ